MTETADLVVPSAPVISTKEKSCPKYSIMQKLYFVYILTNPSHTVFYTGMTNNLMRRMWEHKEKLNPKSFTAKYNCIKLIYFESGESSIRAIEREKMIKDMRRERKIELINSVNPEWKDLFNSIS